MYHQYNVICENETCLFIFEGIQARNSKLAKLHAKIRHGASRPPKFVETDVGACKAPNLTVYHDFPCPACLRGEEDDDESY